MSSIKVVLFLSIGCMGFTHGLRASQASRRRMAQEIFEHQRSLNEEIVLAAVLKNENPKAIRCINESNDKVHLGNYALALAARYKRTAMIECLYKNPIAYLNWNQALDAFLKLGCSEYTVHDILPALTALIKGGGRIDMVILNSDRPQFYSVDNIRYWTCYCQCRGTYTNDIHAQVVKLLKDHGPYKLP